MIRFERFELNEFSRELRLDNRELALQPRIFDLLCYLIKHRDRVVNKDELLKSLWPGVIVTDGSLQRAISLARSALRQGGLSDAIRTHARTGYRFCLEVTQHLDQQPDKLIPQRLGNARHNFEQDNWEAAIAEFQAADAAQPIQGPDLERWANAIQCTGQTWEAVPVLERAIAAHTSQGDNYGAARAMLSLSYIQYEHREYTVAKAWLQRAARLLPDAEISREKGTYMYLASLFATISSELEAAKAYASEAYAIGREIADPDIEALGLNYLGLALQSLGDFKQGAELQDEAAATVLAGNVSPIVGGTIYCSVIWSCRNRGDWERAAQWTDQFTRWCKTSPLHNFPGTCRLHRAEVLSVRGELEEAEQEAKAMCISLSTRAPWAEGDAYQVLGNIYLLRGDLDQAETSFQRAHQLGWDPQPGYALLQVARGATDAALQTLQTSLAMLLANLVIVSLAANNKASAQQAMAELDLHPELYPTDALKAVAYRARAELALFEDDVSEAIQFYRKAIDLWQNVGSPLNVAMIRLLLANALIKNNNRHNAELELQSAQACFQSAGAVTLLKNCIDLKQQMLE
jgi:DNA-binding winged helix-turn-helix (wHTH) protein/Tfp pilus assembly protein PilF